MRTSSSREPPRARLQPFLETRPNRMAFFQGCVCSGEDARPRAVWGADSQEGLGAPKAALLGRAAGGPGEPSPHPSQTPGLSFWCTRQVRPGCPVKAEFQINNN